MQINVQNAPFSRAGSSLAFSILPPAWGHKGLVMRTPVGGSRDAFRIVLMKGGKEQDYKITATPCQCTCACAAGRVDITFPAVDVARIRAQGVDVRLAGIPTSRQYAFPAGRDGSVHVNSAATRSHFLFTPLSGEIKANSQLVVDNQKRDSHFKVKTQSISLDFPCGKEAQVEFAVEYFDATAQRKGLGGTFEDCVEDMRKDWNAWLQCMPAMKPAYRAAGAEAMRVNYMAIVKPRGNIQRPGMLMSKNWMTQIFSWDHCFNAIASSYHDPDMAWDQLMVMFDHQDRDGAIPDCINDVGMSWVFCKPPIHGWTLQKMMQNPKLLTTARLKEIYPKLGRWTDWWLKHRDYDGDGLAEYHHGNDSGWDNATVFDTGYPVAGADLAAFLVVQMDTLALLAKKLGKKTDAKKWKSRADAMLALLLEKLWDGDQFRAKKAFTMVANDQGDSLINFLPIILGARLSPAIRKKVAEGLKPDGRFVTKYGPATENPKSPLYMENGYWRGPIWGPVVVLLCDGLARSGYAKHAREIARRYCDMCNAHLTFAENFDPRSGKPLCDPGYTWGSSAFLILAHEFVQ